MLDYFSLSKYVENEDFPKIQFVKFLLDVK